MAVKKKAKEIPPIDLSPLNSDQRSAFDELRSFIADKEDDTIYVLKGWAGTGKTYCVSTLVRYVLETMHPKHNWYKIGVTGPTNKSVRVLKRTSGLKNPRILFQTIHKLLGLKEKITDEGKQEFIADWEGFKPQIHSVKLLIIDEVSMLNDDLFQKILPFRDKIKIICMGDPAQIPPVGRPDCIPFREELSDYYRIKTLNLKTVMRQKEGNPIIEASVAIRSNLEFSNLPFVPETNLNEKNEGIEFINLNDPIERKRFTPLVEKYFKSLEFKHNSEFVKIIAWRNKTLETMNNLVRSVIYGEGAKEAKILSGENLIANSPIVQEGVVVVTTNEELKVIECEIKSEDLRVVVSDNPDEEPYEVSIKYYETLVSYFDDQDEVIKLWIEILHEDSEEDFKKLTDAMKKRAILKKGADKTWVAYYNMLRRYADVMFSYGISCHKSQGSTYNTTFVLEDDIDANWNVTEKNRIKYTAYTRASKKVYVLKRF